MSCLPGWSVLGRVEPAGEDRGPGRHLTSSTWPMLCAWSAKQAHLSLLPNTDAVFTLLGTVPNC